MNIDNVVTAFKDAGWSGTVYPNLKAAITHINDDNCLWCGYRGYLRRIQPEVCKWHREQNDPECRGCEVGYFMQTQK